MRPRVFWPDGLAYLFMLLFANAFCAAAFILFLRWGEPGRALLFGALTAGVAAISLKTTYFKRVIIARDSVSGPCMDGDLPLALRTSIARSEARYLWESRIGKSTYLLIRHASSSTQIYVDRSIFSDRALAEIRHLLLSKAEV